MKYKAPKIIEKGQISIELQTNCPQHEWGHEHGKLPLGPPL